MNSRLNDEGDINLTDNRKKWIKSLPFETRLLLQEDEKYFIHQALSTPCLEVISDCEGPYIITAAGKRILDFHGNNIHQVGYSNNIVIDAVKAQMDELTFSPRRYTNLKAIELARRLGSLVPGLSRILLAPGGSEANSMALRLARLITGKYKVVSMWGSFHGAGLDTLSVGGDPSFHQKLGPLMPGVIHVPPPENYRTGNTNDTGQESYIDHIRYIFEHESDIGALLVETIRNTDVEIPSLNFWKKIRSLCNDFGVLLILDEIPIGLARTGKMFAFEHYGIVPDILTIGKGLGGGIIPIAALITREEYNIVAEYSIGHFTHEKSPLGSAAAIAVIDFIEREQLAGYALELGGEIAGRLESFKKKYYEIGDIRGLGLLWCIDLVTNRKTKERAVQIAEKILYYCLDKGLSFKTGKGNNIILCPPLTISKSQLDDALDILSDAFGKFLHTL